MPEEIICRKDPPKAYIEFNRPSKRNAMTKSMWKKLALCTRTYCNDDTVKTVIYRGLGGAFSAGDDIREMLSIKTPEEADSFFDVLAQAFKTIIECEKPTIAVVEGPAVGGGAEILLAMDYVIASEDSIIGFPEIHIGLLPPILTTLGIRVLGFRKAKLLALSGSMLSAIDALKLGIVDTITSDVEPEVEKAVKFFLDLPFESVKAIKRVIADNLDNCIMGSLESLKKLSLTRESKERMTAFLEKRLSRSSLYP